MNRDTTVAAPWTTLEIQDEPCLTVLNRLMSPDVLKCLKQPGVTGKAVKYRDKPVRRREQLCLHRDGVGA